MEQLKYKRKTVIIDRLEEQQHKKKMLRRVYYLLLSVIVIFVFLIVAFTVFFKIGEIKIKGLDRYSYEEVLEYLPFAEGENLYSFDSREAEKLLIQEMPFISEIEIKRKIPTTVEITITESKAVMYSYVGGDYYLLSDKLHVLERVSESAWEEPQGVIRLHGSAYARCIVGQTAVFVDERTYTAVTDLYSYLVANEMQEQVSQINIPNRFDIEFFTDRYEIYFGDMNNAEIKMQFLKAVIDTKLGAEEKGFIDASNYREISFRAE